jgi:hypothetical protein
MKMIKLDKKEIAELLKRPEEFIRADSAKYLKEHKEVVIKKLFTPENKLFKNIFRNVHLYQAGYIENLFVEAIEIMTYLRYPDYEGVPGAVKAEIRYRKIICPGDALELTVKTVREHKKSKLVFFSGIIFNQKGERIAEAPFIIGTPNIKT